MKLCFFGAYDPDYPRNLILRKGLTASGVTLSQCWLPPKYKFWLRYPLLFFRSWRYLKNNDILFVPEFGQKDMPLARFLSSIAKTRIVFDPLASRFETKIMDWKRKPADSWQARWNFKIDSWAFSHADLVLADTQAHKEYFCRQYGLDPANVEVVPVGFDSDLFHPESCVEEETKRETFTVLFFGSFLPLHGVKTIIQAAKIVTEEDSTIRFHLVGSGQTLPEAKALTSTLGVANVDFEGWLPPTALPSRLAAADICLGIFGEGEKTSRVIPHKIFQAMAMRKPVITLHTPAVKEIFNHREGIFLCSKPDPSELARAILELKRDSNLREEIAQEGYLRVSQDFSPEAIGRLLTGILERHFRKISKEESR